MFEKRKAAPPVASVTRLKAVRATLLALLTLLSVQFALGMWVNLFGSFPATSDVLAVVEARGDPVLQAHMVTAVVILATAILLIALASRRPLPRSDLGWAVVGLGTVLWAYESGIDLILSGFSSDLDSYSMAMGFLATYLVYGAHLTRVARRLAAREVPAPVPTLSAVP